MWRIAAEAMSATRCVDCTARWQPKLYGANEPAMEAIVTNFFEQRLDLPQIIDYPGEIGTKSGVGKSEFAP